ncbi:MAG TPA: hypothetical protein VFU89_01450 [Rhabdochlamydiaceae bacterium]|nr:hypothetical protein [Rhabdochlamydiaceae bacterium]
MQFKENRTPLKDQRALVITSTFSVLTAGITAFVLRALGMRLPWIAVTLGAGSLIHLIHTLGAAFWRLQKQLEEKTTELRTAQSDIQAIKNKLTIAQTTITFERQLSNNLNAQLKELEDFQTRAKVRKLSLTNIQPVLIKAPPPPLDPGSIKCRLRTVSDLALDLIVRALDIGDLRSLGRVDKYFNEIARKGFITIFRDNLKTVELSSLKNCIPTALPSIEKGAFWAQLYQLEQPKATGIQSRHTVNYFLRTISIKWYLQALSENNEEARKWLRDEINSDSQDLTHEVLLQKDHIFFQLIEPNNTCDKSLFEKFFKGLTDHLEGYEGLLVQIHVLYILGDPAIAAWIQKSSNGLDTISYLGRLLQSKLSKLENHGSSKRWLQQIFNKNEHLPPCYQLERKKVLLALMRSLSFGEAWSLIDNRDTEVWFSDILSMQLQDILNAYSIKILLQRTGLDHSYFHILISQYISNTRLARFAKEGEVASTKLLVITGENWADFVSTLTKMD